jgi:hypothetical protein
MFRLAQCLPFRACGARPTPRFARSTDGLTGNRPERSQGDGFPGKMRSAHPDGWASKIRRRASLPKGAGIGPVTKSGGMSQEGHGPVFKCASRPSIATRRMPREDGREWLPQWGGFSLPHTARLQAHRGPSPSEPEEPLLSGGFVTRSGTS